jgi:hypothetical protein
MATALKQTFGETYPLNEQGDVCSLGEQVICAPGEHVWPFFARQASIRPPILFLYEVYS